MDLRLSVWHFRLIEGSPMKIILEELTVGLPDTTQLVRLTMGLLIAMLLGAVVGIQRERAGMASRKDQRHWELTCRGISYLPKTTAASLLLNKRQSDNGQTMRLPLL